MPRALYDLLPEEVRRQYPPEALDAHAARVLLRPGRVPDDYDPTQAAEAGRLLATVLPRMTQMRAMTSRVRAGQRGELGNPPRALGTRDLDPASPVETATQRIYRLMGQVNVPTGLPSGGPRAIPGRVAQLAARAVAAGAQAAPNLSPFLAPEASYSTRDLVPPAEDVPAHIADLVGGLTGFMATATALRAIPGVGAAGAAGATGALQEGTLKERAIRGVTLTGAAGGAHAAAGRIAGRAPGAIRATAAQVPSAAAFGAGQPWAEAYMHRLTGDKDYTLPTGWDMAKGTGEMLAVNLLLGSRGIAAAGRARASLTREQARHAEVIARAIAPPRGLRPADAAASKRLSDRLNEVLAGRRVWMALPDGSGRGAATVQRVVAYRLPDGTERIHVLASDATSHVPVPVTFRSGEELVRSVARIPRPSETPDVVVPEAEVVRNLPAERSRRLAEAEAKLARLQKSPPGKGDKRYRRWAQRVASLTAERDALSGADQRTAPSPAPVARAPKPTAKPAEVPNDADLDVLFGAPEPAPAVAPAPKRTAVRGGPPVGEERAQGTAAPTAPALPKPEPPEPPTTYRSSSGREQPIRTLPGPHLLNAERKTEPGPLKDALRAEAARRGLALKSPGAPEKEPARPKAAEPPKSPPEAAPPAPIENIGPRAYQGGERVRVPYYGPSKAFGRAVTKVTERGTVIAYDESGRVRVSVERGKGVFEATFPEEKLSRLPTAASRTAAKEKRTKKAKRLSEDLETRIAGSPAKATAIAREFEAKARALFEKAGGSMEHPEYANIRRAWGQVMAVADKAESIRTRLLFDRGVGGLDPEVASRLAGREGMTEPSGRHVTWDTALRRAAEDHPEHFTAERQREILARAEAGEIANPLEMEAAVEFERALVEAGAKPLHAAFATRETDRVRRYLEAERENPLYTDAERAEAVGWAEKVLDPKRLVKPDGFEKAMAEFAERVPRSPADDVPMGSKGEPFGWGEQGFVANDLARAIAGGMWLRVLRGIPRRLAAAWRNVPRANRPRIGDRAGNVLVHGDNLGEYDAFSHSMSARLFAALFDARFSPKDRILTPDREKDLISAGPAEIGYEGRWRGWFTEAFGDAIGSAPMYGTAQRRISRVMMGLEKPESLPARLRGVPERLEAVYQRIRKDVNAVRAEFGQAPIRSFGVVAVKEHGSRFVVAKEARINMPRDQYRVIKVFPNGRRLVETVGGQDLITRYGGPHLALNAEAKSLTQMFEAILGEKAKDSETIPELVSRFQKRRRGGSSMVEDAAHQFEAYVSSMSRLASLTPFFRGIEAELKDMDAQGDHMRARVTRAWLRLQFASKGDPVSDAITKGMNALTFQRNPSEAHELSYSSARHMADRIGVADLGRVGRYWRVPAEARISEREGVKVLGEASDGARLVVSDFGEPVEPARPKLRGFARKAMLEKIKRDARKAEAAGRIPAGMTRAEYAASLLRAQRAQLADIRDVNGANIFRGIRYMQHLSLLGLNLRATLANLAQPLLTLGPEIGYFNAREGWTGAVPQMARQVGKTTRKTTGRLVRALTTSLVARRLMSRQEAARWWRRFPLTHTGSDAAKQIGLLSGEVQRLEHEMALGKVDFEGAQTLREFARLNEKVGAMAPFSVAEDFTRGVAFLSSVAMARRLGLPSMVAARALDPGSPAYHDALIKAAKSIRTPGTAERLAADINSRTMFDYSRYGRAPIFNTPLGGLFGILTTFPTQFASRFMFRPVGGTLKVALAGVRRPFGRVRQRRGLRSAWPGGPGFIPRGGDTWARTPLGAWLREGGATGHDIHGAGVFLRASLFAGLAISATVATGINFALAGTPGWELWILARLSALFPGDPDIKAALGVAQRSAVLDLGRGVPMAPVTRAVAESIARPASAPAKGAELARTLVPLKVALGRYLQNRTDAERLREGGDLHWLAVALGLKTVTPSTSAADEVKGNLGLRSRQEQDERQVRVKKPKPRAKKRSNLISLLGAEPRTAGAVA